MPYQDIEESILAIIRRPGFKPTKPRNLARELNLSEDETRELKRAIKQLVKRKLIAYGANHLVGPPAVKDKAQGYQVTGVFRRAAGGFGFVRPAGSAPGADRTKDVFIAASDSR